MSFRSNSIDDYRAWLYTFAASRRYFLPDSGRAPAPGSRLVQADLGTDPDRDPGSRGGRFLPGLGGRFDRGGDGAERRTHLPGRPRRAIARSGASRSTINYRGYTIYSMPPASSGGVTLALILNIMEGYGALPPFGSAALLHREAEAMRRAFTDRNTYLGDPGVREDAARPAALQGLRRDPAAADRSASHATPTPPFDPSLRDGTSTTHYSVVDAEGNAVSCTTTLNDSYGSCGGGFRSRVPAQRRDGRLHDGARASPTGTA